MASRQEGTLLQEFCRIGKKWKKINKHKVFYVIKKEEICSVINPKNYGKKNLLAFAEKIGNFTLNVTMVDEAGNPLTADDISQCHLSGFPILLKMNYLKHLQKKFSSNSLFGNPYRRKTSKSATKKNGSSNRYR